MTVMTWALMLEHIVLLVFWLGVVFWAIVILCSPRGRTIISNKVDDRKRSKADSGKLQCEAEDCSDIATHATPLGYFCEWDRYENQTKRYLNGGRMSYMVELRHVKNRTPE